MLSILASLLDFLYVWPGKLQVQREFIHQAKKKTEGQEKTYDTLPTPPIQNIPPQPTKNPKPQTSPLLSLGDRAEIMRENE